MKENRMKKKLGANTGVTGTNFGRHVFIVTAVILGIMLWLRS
jgi:hypothetical protein